MKEEEEEEDADRDDVRHGQLDDNMANDASRCDQQRAPVIGRLVQFYSTLFSVYCVILQLLLPLLLFPHLLFWPIPSNGPPTVFFFGYLIESIVLIVSSFAFDSHW